MSKLIYSSITSLDGYVEDEQGNFDWAEPDEELHSFINHLERPVGTYLYGRRMYETMVYWESSERQSDPSPVSREFADIWRAAEKIVFSRTLRDVSSSLTRVERRFDPESVREMKAVAPRDIAVGGAELAGHAFRARLVDELQLFVVPVVLGGGKRSLPRDIRIKLELLDSRRFEGGALFLQYRIRI